VSERRLERDGQRLAISGKPFEVLRLLVEAGGRLVERETFNARLWPAVTVEDRNLTVHISTLRRILGSGEPQIDYIETVAKGGYRLSVPVRVIATGVLTASPGTSPLPEAVLLQCEARAQLAKGDRLPALKALGLFERALALDPTDAATHAGLASTYLFLGSTLIRRPLPIEDAVRLARESALRALALDERQAEAWAVLGQIKMFHDWDWQGAGQDLARAAAIAPDSVEAAEAWGWFLCAMGSSGAAIEMLTRARRLDPLRRETVERLGLALWFVGEGERAAAILADASAIDPAARRPHFRRMVVLDDLGRHDDAMIERAVWLRLTGEEAACARVTGLCRVLERMNQSFEAALQWMVIGERHRALDALERSVLERATNIPFLLQFPSLRTLHGELRFKRLAEQAGLFPDCPPPVTEIIHEAASASRPAP
jgi:DNA-binding winged helix-turn-helix (wHTH) protein